MAPILVPLTTSILTALVVRRRGLQQAVSFAGSVLFLLAALGLLSAVMRDGAVHVALGGWPAPFGVEIRVDRLGAAMVMVTALTGALCLLFQASDVDRGPWRPLLLPQVHALLAGVGGAFVTADLFNLYVWIELMLIAALGLFVLGGRLRQLDAAYRYLVLNIAGTVLLLLAVALAYGATGHLNFGAVSQAARDMPPALVIPVAGTLVLAMLMKAGAFPFAAWLPASYHTLSAPVLALFAGLLTKVGVYAVLRLMGGVFAPAPGLLNQALGWIAAATMLVGVMGAAYHWDMRRILAFHIVSQIGYILLGIAIATPMAYAAALFYTVHHILVKANLFLIAGLVAAETGDYDLRRIGGVWGRRPLLGVLFLIPALSLVGIPPLSGFWAKLLILREAIAGGHVAWTVIALVVSALTLYSMTKVWIEAFWKDHPAPVARVAGPGRGLAWAATMAFALLTLVIGLGPQALLQYALDAAATLGGPAS